MLCRKDLAYHSGRMRDLAVQLGGETVRMMWVHVQYLGFFSHSSGMFLLLMMLSDLRFLFMKMALLMPIHRL